MQYAKLTYKEGVQFLSDELSEVGDNLKLTVQFLIADFAAVSELSGKKYPLSSENRRFVFVCAYIQDGGAKFGF